MFLQKCPVVIILDMMIKITNPYNSIASPRGSLLNEASKYNEAKETTNHQKRRPSLCPPGNYVKTLYKGKHASAETEMKYRCQQ